jgi:hypothetical protein
VTGATRVGVSISVGIGATLGLCTSVAPTGPVDAGCVDTGDVGSTNGSRTTNKAAGVPEAVVAMAGSTPGVGITMTGAVSIGGLAAGRLP